MLTPTPSGVLTASHLPHQQFIVTLNSGIWCHSIHSLEIELFVPSMKSFRTLSISVPFRIGGFLVRYQSFRDFAGQTVSTLQISDSTFIFSLYIGVIWGFTPRLQNS